MSLPSSGSTPKRSYSRTSASRCNWRRASRRSSSGALCRRRSSAWTNWVPCRLAPRGLYRESTKGKPKRAAWSAISAAASVPASGAGWARSSASCVAASASSTARCSASCNWATLCIGRARTACSAAQGACGYRSASMAAAACGVASLNWARVWAMVAPFRERVDRDGAPASAGRCPAAGRPRRGRGARCGPGSVAGRRCGPAGPAGGNACRC